MSLLDLLISVGFLIWILRYLRPDRHLSLRHPPGPSVHFPLLGYMPFFAYKPLERLQSLASNYGEICTVFLGGYRQVFYKISFRRDCRKRSISIFRVVVLNSFNAIREAFKLDAFSGRPALKMLEVRNGGMVNVGKCINILNNSSHKCAHSTLYWNVIAIGLVCSEGKTWIEQRKFTLKTLKELGFGKPMEGLLMQEVAELVSFLG